MKEGQTMIESTVVLIKPDAFDRRIVGKLLAIIEDGPFSITDLDIYMWTYAKAAEFYGRQHADKPYFVQLVKQMSSGRLMQMQLHGDGAILKWRNRLQMLRDLRIEKGYVGPKNLLHGSDSVESYEHESKVLWG